MLQQAYLLNDVIITYYLHSEYISVSFINTLCSVFIFISIAQQLRAENYGSNLCKMCGWFCIYFNEKVPTCIFQMSMLRSLFRE